MKRKFTKYPSTAISASSYGNPVKSKYNTVGDLKKALSQFPDSYPIRVIGQHGWGIDENQDLCFINDIVDYDDACEIEIF